MTAAEHLNPQQFPIEKIAAMTSKDFDKPMHSIEPDVRARDEESGRPPVDIWVDHMRQHGIREPVHIEGGYPIETHGEVIAHMPDMVRDGHHRYVAARLAGLTSMPLVYHAPVKDSRGIHRYPSLGQAVD
jgi:hypothetical protein